MSTISYGWCRVEGAIVHNTEKSYGYTLTSPIKTDTVFYGKPSIQIYNRSSAINGVIYKVVSAQELSGYSTVRDIDTNYTAFKNAIDNYDKTIDINDNTNAAQLYYKEFTIEETSVIFYDDATRGNFRYYAIVYVDKDLTPPIISITAKYVGPSIPVDTTFKAEDVHVYAEYEDGNKEKVVTGYVIEPDDRKITKTGPNIFDIKFTDNTGYTFPACSIIVEGIKRLTGIRGIYDGPSLHQGQAVERRYLIIIAEYSDGSSGTVTSYGFPNGNIIGTSNNVDISYNGCRCTITIPTYSITSSRLVAFYTGPNIEFNPNNPFTFDTTKTKIQIYYNSSDGLSGGWEPVDSSLCTFTPTTIEHEGPNYITVQYNGRAGLVSCKMIVIGIVPDVTITGITAEYTGPSIVQGNQFKLERLIVKAFYSDGTSSIIKNGFTCNKYIVENIGDNVFLCTYTYRPSSGNDVTVTDTFTVIGIEKDSTTETNYTPISLDNNYPEATKYNNRYRGPAESFKHQYTNNLIYQNILELYKLFSNIEANYNNLIENIESSNAIKYSSINQINHINDGIKTIMNDPNFIYLD